MIILGIFFSYLLGSIPTAYLYGKIYKGIDIRMHGSGNVGATNVFRVLGKGPGSIVLAIDILKGILAVVLVSWIFALEKNMELIVLSVAAICGHNWTVFLKFKGGKGIATSLGALIGLTIKIASIRLVLLVTVGIFLIIFLSTGFVSLASITASTALPVIMLITVQPIEFIFLGAIMCIFVVIRHKPNIRRLLDRQEPRVDLFKKNKDT